MTFWRFFIDVGGTFTDVVARSPDGDVHTFKLLSTGAIRGVARPGSDSTHIVDPARRPEPPGFWTGYRLRLDVDNPLSLMVIDHDPHDGTLYLRPPASCLLPPAFSYELRSGEEAPVVAIRYLMGKRLDEPIGPVEVRLGTTRATNALLERKGARVAFVTTKGFADILKIGTQDRPALFELNIRKRDELAATSIEIDERISATGEVLLAPQREAIRNQLEQARLSGIAAVGICLLHAHVNPRHEDIVAEIADAVGFDHVAVSSRLARLEGLVARGDTTVADAYLGAVIQSYVAALRRSMPEARLSLMTNNGGVVSADAIAGKDTILSGPAGGVVGCAHVTRAAGYDHAIGFDMGGTSTDVSRVGPSPDGLEYQYETVKAGVRIVTPMLAVETVAAGGGSLCAFDGQKLVVGPQSAGADPGPACYGRGGPLTVTDMNVFLGRVVPEHFPFRLDLEAVRAGLEELRREMADRSANLASSTPDVKRQRPAQSSAGERRYRLVELADGFVQIANANMAAAIKRISVSKGYDVRDYVLCSFGGAGGQHACAIARSLGMTRVLFSPYAGVLSALGAGVTDVKRIEQQSVRFRLDEGSGSCGAIERLRPVFDAMDQNLCHTLLAEGVEASALSEPVHTVDVCYEGQATLITVPATTSAEIEASFEEAHERLYGYRHEGRSIEIRVARTEVTARAAHLALPPCPVATHSGTPDAPSRHTRLYVHGSWHNVPVYLREDLAAGHAFCGPAVVIEPTSTIVVEPGWDAFVNTNGDVVLTFSGDGVPTGGVSVEVDPIQLELFNNQFTAIATQMGATLRRTALSTNVKERLDYSCAIFTPAGDLVVNAPHIPVHLGAMSACIKALMEDVGMFAPGDVYITNDPYRGGSHLNDVTVISPVLDERTSRILFFVASRAHHAEIGGTRPGSMPPDSTCLADEGVVIRAFRWIENGRPRAEALRMLLTAPPYPSRAPDENLADITAQVAANQTGVRDLKQMIARYGQEVVHAYMGHIQAAAENKMRAALARLPDGEYRFQDHLDDGSPLQVAIRIRGDQAIIDFAGTGPVLPGNLNANRAIVTSAVLYCLRCLIDEDIPLNAGVLAPVEIVLPECFLNPRASADPAACPAMVGGNVETSQRVVDVILGALGVAAASQGTMNNLLMGDATFGYYETICGGAGAGPGFDGADAVHTHMTNTRLTDPEVLEARVPVRLLRFTIRRGSGGAGRFHGGCGVVREFESLRPLEVSILSQRRTTAPYGLNGGEPGQPGRNLLQSAGSTKVETLPPITRLTLEPGDRLTIETPGGGGYGSPT